MLKDDVNDKQMKYNKVHTEKSNIENKFDIIINENDNLKSINNNINNEINYLNEKILELIENDKKKTSVNEILESQLHQMKLKCEDLIIIIA